MELKELKQCILNNSIEIDFFVFLVEKNSDYIAEQYVDMICANNSFIRRRVDSLSEIQNTTDSMSFIMDSELVDDLYVLKTEKFDEEFKNYGDFSRTIVICNKIDKKILSRVEPFIIKFPKICDWQIKSHMYKLCPRISGTCIDLLYTVTDGDIYRIDNEINKALLFPNEEDKVMTILLNEPSSDLYALSTFTFVDAVVKKDKILVASALHHLKDWDSDPMFILTLLLNKYKQIMLVHGNCGLTAEELGMTPKGFNAIKFYNKGHNLDEVRKKIKFLSGINLKINLGQLAISGPDLLSYMLVNLM